MRRKKQNSFPDPIMFIDFEVDAGRTNEKI